VIIYCPQQAQILQPLIESPKGADKWLLHEGKGACKRVVEVLVAAAREKLQLSMPSKLFGWVSLEQAPTRERKLCVLLGKQQL
jgi:hypothetical protein